MRTERPTHTVLMSSRTEGNPYDVGREYDLNAVLYCQGAFDSLVREAARGYRFGGRLAVGRSATVSLEAERRQHLAAVRIHRLMLLGNVQF